MDWAKIIDDLMARALSTTYEGERAICLKKLNKIKLKYNVAPGNKTKKDEKYQIPIERLRELFVETYFPWYLKNSIFVNEERILYQFSSFKLRNIYETEVHENIPTSASKKYLMHIRDIGIWAKDELEYIKSLPTVLRDLYYFNYYVEIDKTFGVWCSSSLEFSRANGSVETLINNFNDEFINKKTEFMEKINNGYYDPDIKSLFNPELLED